MGIILTIVGFLLMPIALIWLLVNFFRKKKKLIPSLSIAVGAILCVIGLWIVGSNVTSEELAALEEKKIARAEAKEAKLEAERLEKEKTEEVERKKQVEKQKQEKEIAEKEKAEKLEEETKLQEEERQKQELATKEKEEKERIATKIAEEKAAKEKAEVEKLAKEQAEKASIKVIKTEEQKKTQKKAESLDELYEGIFSIILGSEGRIKNIKPALSDNWSATIVEVDNEWYLLSAEEKKYVAETLGPIIESLVIESGAASSSYVTFVDQNNNEVATQKVFGGYNIKK